MKTFQVDDEFTMLQIEPVEDGYTLSMQSLEFAGDIASSYYFTKQDMRNLKMYINQLDLE